MLCAEQPGTLHRTGDSMDPAVAAQLQSLKAKWAPQSAGGAAFSAAGAADGSGVASVEQFELADQRRLEEGESAHVCEHVEVARSVEA